MAPSESRGMSLKMVSVLTIALVTYFLWGGAAAIYQGKLDEQAIALATENGDAQAEGGFEDDGVTPRIRIRRGSALVSAVVITIAGVWTFISNSVIHLGHLPSLIPYMFQERMGYLIFCVAVLIATGLGLLWMGNMQRSLESENPFSKGRPRKKLPKIRMPKALDED